MTDDAVEEPRPADEPPKEDPKADPKADAEDRGLIELLAAILLGLAGLMTAYAAYYGSLSDGDSLEGYTSSQRSTSEANGDYGDYSQTYSADQNVFLQYKIQLDQGNKAIADDIRANLFSDGLEKATVEWEKTADSPDARATPLDTDAYVVQSYLDYTEANQRSQDQFDEAKKTNEQGDNYGLASVFFAVALFAAGIAALFKIRKLSIAMLIGSAILIAPGMWAVAKGKGWIS